MTSTKPLPGRPVIGLLTLTFIVLLLLVDASRSTPINPYAAPEPVALGSGQPPEGAHCTDL